MARRKRGALGLPEEIAAIRAEIRRFLNTEDEQGKSIGAHKQGAYAFYDFDGEPIYVGQTLEMLRTRIQRHLTNQRTDAVAMNVLDPFEVAFVEVWPLDTMAEGLDAEARKSLVCSAEYTVFQKVLRESELGAVLNEKDVPKRPQIDLPTSYRGRIVPERLFVPRSHPDVRIARRAATIANLARVIGEREVSRGLRRTLLVQARRLEHLASKRVEELGIQPGFEQEP